MSTLEGAGAAASAAVLAAVLAAAGQVAALPEVDETLDPVAAGFDSVAIMELAARLEDELGVDCTLEDVFDSASLAALADLLTRRLAPADR
jgi:acyl carrier protein